MELPLDLRNALDVELASSPSKRLASATAALSQRYRNLRPSRNGLFLGSDEDVAAYAAYRMPATFAAIFAALVQLHDQWLGEPPKTLLDVGAGPGTAIWVARTVWPGLDDVLLLERDARMIAFGQRLAARAQTQAIRDARWRQADLLSAWESDPSDLVIAGYVLNEIPEAQRETVIDHLWSKTTGALLLIEPGTPVGFGLIRTARAHLIESGATVLAPCPHDRACPMPENDWCHFAQRVNRTRLHRAVKGGTLSYEDEKFSYVAVSRQPRPAIAGRILRHPQILTGRVVLELCAPQGLRSEVITRSRDRQAFRQARDLKWGDALLPEEEDRDGGV